MIDLKPINQKSFYHKAKIYTDKDGSIVLHSYNTDVIKITKGGEIIRLWNGYSNTTKKHINDFLVQNGFKPMNKKEWLSLPCTNNDKVYNMYMHNGFFTYKSQTLLTEREAEVYFKKLQETHPRMAVWYE